MPPNRLRSRFPWWILSALFLQAICLPGLAQLTADFTPSQTSGCSPLAVSFINSTTGQSSAASYTWNFGNGNGITTTDMGNPVSATYFTGQNYTVTLTVRDGVSTSVQTKIITVYKGPAIAFTGVNTMGCAPLVTGFTAAASAGDGSISGYFWDFGDGNTLSTTSAAVSNTYLFPGSYSVSLTVTNSFGCSNTLKKTNLVTVYPALVPDFSADTATICRLDQSIHFTNLSTGTGTLSYAWSFGDGGTSGIVSPDHQYSAKGTYPVTLTVTNASGCSATKTKPAYIHAADFTPDFTNNAVSCTGSPVSFTDASSPNPTGLVRWDFGDGGSGIGQNILHNYVAAGTYNVKLYQNFGSCPDTLSKNIVVSDPPVLSPFAANKGGSCQSPMLVNFTDSSFGAVKWHWNFTGNAADTSNLQNPGFLYSTNGLYTPTLTVTNAAGCTATVSQLLNSAQPTATIRADTLLTPSAVYCSDVTATFHAVSQDTLATWNWSFGDGTTSTAPDPAHMYTLPGTYIINLSFTTIHGCAGTAFPPDTIIVYPKPHASFTAVDSMPCASNQTEIFTNLADSSERFTWFYGDGSSDVNNDVVHTHGYPAAGSYTMTLIASSPGCANDTATLTRYVVSVPMPVLTVTNNCDSDRLTVAMAVTPAGADEYIWYYGDGSPNDTDMAYVPVRNHHYPGGGAYTASVSAIFGSCVQTSGPVRVFALGVQHPLLASPKDTICVSATLPVTISGVDTNYQRKSVNGGSYYHVIKWQYDDGSTLNPSGNTGFRTLFNGNVAGLQQGRDSVRAIVQSDFFNCTDTTNYIPIHITGPVANFGALDQVCYRTAVIFTDSSAATDGVPLVSWKWSYGDGNSATRGTNDTVLHQYAFPGNYTPTLTVTDSNGCAATVKRAASQINIYGSKADFNWTPANITPGFPVTFHNTSTTNAGATFEWLIYSDGTTSTNKDSLQHSYSNIGIDSVRLIASATGAGTCADTTVHVLRVASIGVDFTDSTAYINNANCPPMVAYFKSETYNTTSLHWDFGDGATADNNPNPSHTYALPGTYIITLTGYGANGISDSAKDTLMVKGPFGTLYSSLLQACIPAIDTLHTTASYAGSYTWDFGDGTVVTTQDTLATHQYTLPGLFTPSLILTDSTGCQITFRYDKQLLMDTLHVQLGPPVVLCDTGLVSFGPHVLSFVADSLHYPLTYHWDFGTGISTDTSADFNPSFHYTYPGDFVTTVSVSSPIGCVSTASDSVHIVPPVLVHEYKDTVICIGGSAPLYATGAFSYTWSPASSLNKTEGDSVVAKPSATTVYSVIGEDKFKCFTDTATATVYVDSLPSVVMPPGTAVLPGESTTLTPVVSSDVIKYLWTPPGTLDCDTCAIVTSFPRDPVTYTLQVTTEHGCVNKATVHVDLLCGQNGVNMANAFTPNHDGNNDLFYPAGSGIRLIRFFQVYSRWGELLYSRKDFQANDMKYGWNGTLNGIDQPAGTYVYMATMECYGGDTFTIKGTVELLR